MGGEEMQSGLTLRSYLTVIYTVVIFGPALIWVFLTTWQLGLLGVLSWVAFIFAEEIGRLSGRPLTKQESTIIYLTTGVTGTVTTSVGFIYAGYFRQSEYAQAYGIAQAVPEWFAPSSILVWDARTLFNSAWLIPIGLSLVFMVLTLAADLAMGWFTKTLYIDVEKLPFPLQQLSADAILTMTEREPGRMRMFVFGTDVGLIVTFVLYGFPLITSALGFVAPPLSDYVPWIDLNQLLHLRAGIKGASFGISLEPAIFVSGFIVPFMVVVSMFIGSFAIYFVGNLLLVQLSLTEFAKEWFGGMNIALTMQRSTLHAWISPTIGILLAAGVMPLIRYPRLLIASFKGMAASKVGRGTSILYGLLALWLGASLASVLIVYYLVPGYPVWIMLFFSIFWSFFWSIVIARAIGLTGIAPSPPGLLDMMKYGYINAAGYSGVDIWFINPVISMGGAGWCQSFKVAELCSTKPSSYVKAYLLALPVALIAGFVIVDRFWAMAPMPSSVYPGTATYWPISALTTTLWITGAQRAALIVPTWVVGGFGAGAIVYLAVDFLKIPFSIIGFATGTVSALPVVFTMLVGGLAGKMMERWLGKERWNREKSVLGAGILLGEALILVFATAVSIAAKSIWVLPY